MVATKKKKKKKVRASTNDEITLRRRFSALHGNHCEKSKSTSDDWYARRDLCALRVRGGETPSLDPPSRLYLSRAVLQRVQTRACIIPNLFVCAFLIRPLREGGWTGVAIKRSSVRLIWLLESGRFRVKTRVLSVGARWSRFALFRERNLRA